MKFKTLAKFLNKIENTPSRLEMTAVLADLFKQSQKDEIDKVCYLSLGRLAPKYEGIEFNLAEKMMVRIIARSTKFEEKEVLAAFKEIGDLGDVIKRFKKTKDDFNLSVSDVFEMLFKIAQDSGTGSQERKIKKMAELLEKLDSLSAKYIARIPVNRLRLGFSDMTVLDALSWMENQDKSLRPELERAFNVLADVGKIAFVFKTKGIKGIKKIKSEVGIPIRAALAERLKKPEEILEKMDGQCALEPKMDGFRCQIHFDRSKKFKLKDETNLSLFENKEKYFVRIFSRNLDNTTHMFPEIIKAVQKLKVDNAILDGEAIAFDPQTKKFLSFQETVQRKRKHGILEKAIEVPLKVFVFDILYLNNKPLLNMTFKQRRTLLEKILNKSKGEEKAIILTRQIIVKKPNEFNQFFEKVVSEELEGLMAKKLDAVYQAGNRNFNWVKYKVGMQSDLADTIDCVVMGYYKGKGKRTNFGIGAFLVGIVDKNKFLTVSKIGIGLTDKQWREIHKRCQKLKTYKKPKEYQVNKNINPDVWCKPGLIVEIEADTITRSPIHTAKLALRFPRLKRFRDDKSLNETTKKNELERLLKS
ncbi:DNA ligase [Candidatus Beckwithbacteria bacterium CG10_big_fil_rev_8_21_14_0_10_34_10]|uniref:DNA ligase n=1 Tax=Candidatus Beckwithbacteria bacterium CG10_big_fil_rev_8_21_14_0_10_34_10 TaxID=1974495 RepID=A0A2H0W7Z2_9BACT|nr:MAG: DNA ligase [Candidatus Beckwithbacteria bacterium CG10_big_fil_rev_8_21_14_0_10_34_10]